MKRTFIQSLVVLVAVLVFSVPAARAGGGAGFGGTESFECYAVTDQSPGDVVTYTTDAGTRTVRIGSARLLCLPITSPSFAVGSVNLSFDPNQASLLKCYVVAPTTTQTPNTPTPGAAPQVISVIDPFASETLALEAPQLLCNGAQLAP